MCARRSVGTPYPQILKIFTIWRSLKSYLENLLNLEDMRTLSTVLVPGCGNLEIKTFKIFKIWGAPTCHPLIEESIHTGSQYFQVCQDFQDSQDCRDLLVGSKWVRAARAARTARHAGLHVATHRMRGATSRGSYVRVGEWALPITRS